jgi:hypothetical protein
MVWCNWRANHCTIFLEGRLRGAIYSGFLELMGLLEEVPLIRRTQMYFQHNEAAPRISRYETQHQNAHFPSRRIGRDAPQNWTQQSPDCNTLYFHVWDIWNTLFINAKWTREDLIGSIVDADTHINDRYTLRQVVHSVMKRARNGS